MRHKSCPTWRQFILWGPLLRTSSPLWKSSRTLVSRSITCSLQTRYPRRWSTSWHPVTPWIKSRICKKCTWITTPSVETLSRWISPLPLDSRGGRTSGMTRTRQPSTECPTAWFQPSCLCGSCLRSDVSMVLLLVPLSPIRWPREWKYSSGTSKATICLIRGPFSLSLKGKKMLSHLY